MFKVFYWNPFTKRYSAFGGLYSSNAVAFMRNKYGSSYSIITAPLFH